MATPTPRATALGGLSPEIIETIARLLPCPTTFLQLMHALPLWAKTRALAAIARLCTTPTMCVMWPTITVLCPDLSSVTFQDLVDATALAPRIAIGYAIGTRNEMAAFAFATSWITSLTFEFPYGLSTMDEAEWTFFRSTITSCKHLETLRVTDCVSGCIALGDVIWNLPRLTSLSLAGHRSFSTAILTNDFCTRLIQWLEASPVVCLVLKDLRFDARPSSPLCLQLCDAIASSTTLATLALENVSIFARVFLCGRPLPAHLTSLEWEKTDLEETPDEGWTNFASAFATGPQLVHLGCKKFEALLRLREFGLEHSDETLAKIRGLESLDTTGVGRGVLNREAFLRFAGSMTHLTSLTLWLANFEGRYARDLANVLSTLPRLAVLKITERSMYDAEVVYFLQHVPQFGRLAHLDISSHRRSTASLLAMLPVINAAAAHLQTIRLQVWWLVDEVEMVAKAAAQLPDCHFAMAAHPKLKRDAATTASFARVIEANGMGPRHDVVQCVLYV
ncbi:hypothetical protein SDRG_14477 [Saprolegnia diclina VS20]|uniref:F-box domain-containing protein n=1 Tax=Saprolegnia diclina (strain VS20) TaxID=1156394 RepID=T0PZP4_SAPDV|nr:hypothetical protein SDRG_14477 [Saprolegnia diclina VS20]EQC27726.1 hypothetical protein SDRG_14477 [Saprolegnia diclina VS20]|eukprot:XP_008618831.1 hypothetical protein SDRG_14477 [Saprolegnia diclina VS20]